MFAPALMMTVSCAGLVDRTGQHAAASRERAAAIYDHLKTSQAAGDFAAAALDAHELILSHPQFSRIDEVTYRAGEIATERGLDADAARFFDAVVSDYPLSEYHARALLASADAYERLDMPARAVDRLLVLLESPADEELRRSAAAALGTLQARLSPAELEKMTQTHPDSPLTRRATLDMARKEYARGRYDDAYERLARYVYQYPDDPGAAEARRLLRACAQRRQEPPAAQASPADPDVVGVVLPVTGPGSLYGRYFADGVDAALSKYNASHSRQVRLAKVDSKGSPVGAVKAVRGLILEAGAVGIVGSVFTAPTIAACIEANAWGTALISPVVSNDDLAEIGPWVFLTKVPLAVEVSAIAELAVSRMAIERFALVAPSAGERRKLGDLFVDEIGRLGGDVVAVEYYEPGATDFRGQLEAVRDAAPEAIFAPGSVEELLLLIPQVKFYDLQLQLLGLSNWNSEKLLRLSRDELEGALFPLEAYRGKDRAAYVEFKEAMAGDNPDAVNPVTESGYFGMRLMLQALDAGAMSREDVRAFLEGELRRGANGRMAEAHALSFLRVQGGRVREFRATTGQ